MGSTVGRDFDEAVGSRYWREADARAVLDAWVASGEAVVPFASRFGLSPQRLERWRQRLMPETTPEGMVTFFPVMLSGRAEGARETSVPPVAVAWSIEISGGVRVQVPCAGGAELLAGALRAVREVWSC